MTTSTRPQSGGAAAPALLSGRTAFVVLAVILIADFMELLDATIVSVAAPAIAEDLDASESSLQWMMAGYTLAAGAGLITGGRIGDQFGRRRVFLLGLAAFMLASAGCGLAPSSGEAFTAILPWQVACYLAAAALMFLLPRRANAAHE
jgi:MFS family permease